MRWDTRWAAPARARWVEEGGGAGREGQLEGCKGSWAALARGEVGSREAERDFLGGFSRAFAQAHTAGGLAGERQAARDRRFKPPASFWWVVKVENSSSAHKQTKGLLPLLPPLQTATLLYEMQRRGKAARFGVVSMCIGSGAWLMLQGCACALCILVLLCTAVTPALNSLTRLPIPHHRPIMKLVLTHLTRF